MLAGSQRLVEDCENLAMLRKLSSLLLETEILLMTLPRSALLFKSNFRYSACAFLLNNLPLLHISSKTIGKIKICEYLNVWNLRTILCEYRLSCVSIQSQFRTFGLYMLTAQNLLEMFLRVPFKSSQFQRSYRLSNNNERDFDARI